MIYTSEFTEPFISAAFKNLMDFSFGSNRGVNLYRTKEGNTLLQFLVPGYSKEDLVVRTEGNILVIEGSPPDKKEAYKDYTQQFKGFPIRNVNYRFPFANTLNPENIKARCEDGILYVEITPSAKSNKQNVTID